MKEVRTPHPRWHTCIFLSEGSVGHRRSEEVLLGAERVQVQVVVVCWCFLRFAMMD